MAFLCQRIQLCIVLYSEAVPFPIMEMMIDVKAFQIKDMAPATENQCLVFVFYKTDSIIESDVYNFSESSKSPFLLKLAFRKLFQSVNPRTMY